VTSPNSTSGRDPGKRMRSCDDRSRSESKHRVKGIRLGLCCIFRDEPIRFRTTRASYLARLTRKEVRQKLSEICLSNVESLYRSLEFCNDSQIGCFRVLSQLLPLYTHREYGYRLEDLGDNSDIRRILGDCRRFSEKNQIRLTFHPDQFVVLNSPRE
jgi:UV DNA damage endonuclease